MTYIKINDTLYPATVNGKLSDREWGNRDSKAITLEMDHNTALSIFVDDLDWSIVQQSEVTVFQTDENGEIVLGKNGEPIQTGTEMQETEYDNAEYCVAGSITDNRNGTVTVKMGKPTDAELLAILMGGN